MKRKMQVKQTNQQGLKRPRLTPQRDTKGDDTTDVTKQTSSQDSEGEEASDEEQYKDTCAPKSKQIDKSRKPRMELDHVHGISVPDSIEKDRQSEEGNGDEHINSKEELEETVSKPKGSGPTPNHSVDKITTQRNFLCGVESKEGGGDDKHEKERERQAEQVSQKGMPTFSQTCLYNGTSDEDVNASEPKDDCLKEESRDDVNDDEQGKEEEDEEEESKDGATKSKKEQENESTSPIDTGSYKEVQESTSKASTYVKDDNALVKTQSRPFQRVWMEKDETTLLEAIGSYKTVHGKEPCTNDLLTIINEKISFEPNIKQVKNKIRSLKKIKKNPSQEMIADTCAEKGLFCSSEKVRGVTQSKPFQRVWTEKDETTLLEAIGSYKVVHGKEPNTNDLLNIINGKISFEPNIKQVKNKIGNLKRIKKNPSQGMTEDTRAEKKLFCSSEKVPGVNKMSSTIAQSSKRKEKLKDTEITSTMMTLFQGNEADEVMKLETSISRVAQLIASGLPTKWKDMIKAQVNQYLIGLDNRKAKLELLLQMMEMKTREHDDNDTE